MKQLKRNFLSIIAATVIMLLSICLLSKLDFLPGMSVSARAETYDYYVKIVDNRGGKVTVTSGNSSVTTVTSEAGFYYVKESSIITVEPDENFRLFDIRLFQDGSEKDPKNILKKQNDNTYKLYVSRFCNYEVRVTFVSINEHSITIRNDNTCGYYESKVKRDGSVIDTDNESPKAKEGDIIEIKFVPNKKYTISDIVINLIADRTVEYDESTDTYTLTFTMKDLDNVTVSPRYENKKYNINIVSTEHGTITITENNTNPKWGQTITLNVTPEDGYRLSSIKVMADNTQITVTDNTFRMPDHDVTLTAEFELIDYTITKSNVHGTVITKVNEVNSNTDTAHYGDTVTITATPNEGYGLITYTVRDADGNIIPVIDNIFTMPASNITVTAVFAEPKEPVAYIDADGTEKTVEYYTVLDESQTELTEGWYVVNSISLTVKNTLKPSGNVNIILVDGCGMNVYTGTYSLECETYTNLCIYGQNKGTGEMVLNSNASGTSVYIKNGSLTINGGFWMSYKTYISGTDSTKDCFTINGGDIFMQAFNSNAPLEIKGGKCSINGGKVELQCEYDDSWSIKSDCGITLGYKKGSDYLEFNKSLSNSTVTIAEGVTFTDGTNTYDHNTPSDELKALSGRKLVPAYAVNIAESTGGTVTADKNAIAIGASDKTVTLTVTPNAGYKFKSLVINNGAVSVTDNQDGTFTFEMPDEDVVVSVEFIKFGTLSSAQVYLFNNITVKFYTYFEHPLTTEPTLTITMNGKQTIIQGEWDSAKTRYVFEFTGIQPDSIGELFTAELSYVDGNDTYTERKENYSVKQYCIDTFALVNSMNLTSEKKAELKTLLADVLLYGAAAQKYVDFTLTDNSEQLVTHGVSEEILGCATKDTGIGDDGVLANTDIISGSDKKRDDVNWYKANVNLNNSATLQFYFKLAKGTEFIDINNNVLTFKKGEDTYTITVKIDQDTEARPIYAVKDGVFYVELTQMSANTFADTHIAKIYLNGTDINQNLNYSMNTYVKRIVDNDEIAQNFKELAMRLYYYGKSAKAYTTA